MRTERLAAIRKFVGQRRKGVISSPEQRGGRKPFVLGGLIVSLLVPNIGLTADNCSGHYVNVLQSAEAIDQSSGNSLALFKVATVNIADDRNSPINMSVGHCVGTSLAVNGKTDTRGHCTRKDRDGDLYSYEWALPAGVEKGTWKFIGGTGKYANAKWFGWWQQTMAEGETAGGIWGGNCR